MSVDAVLPDKMYAGGKFPPSFNSVASIMKLLIALKVRVLSWNSIVWVDFLLFKHIFGSVFVLEINFSAVCEIGVNKIWLRILITFTILDTLQFSVGLVYPVFSPIYVSWFLQTCNLCSVRAERKRKRKLTTEQEDTAEAASLQKKSRSGWIIKVPRRFSKGAWGGAATTFKKIARWNDSHVQKDAVVVISIMQQGFNSRSDSGELRRQCKNS